MISNDPILSIHADLADILHLGHTPSGERRLIGILGGRVEGPRLRGHILPGGADWQIVRPDGVAEVSARYAVETENGARVLVESEGLRHGPPDVMERLARDEAVEASAYYFRTVMRFATADLSLDWLNRIIAIARGTRRPRAVSLEVFEVL